MESPLNTGEIVKTSTALPKIDLDPNLYEKDTPYNVNCDNKKCAKLLYEFGMSDEAIKNFTIRFTRKPMMGNKSSIMKKFLLGQQKGNKITFYTDRIWQKFQESKNENSLKGKAIKFYKMTLGSGGQGETNDIALHEFKHALDTKNTALKLLNIAVKTIYDVGGAAGIGFAIYNSSGSVPLSSLAVISLPIIDLVNPYEIRARIFAKKNENNLKWQNLISLIPK